MAAKLACPHCLAPLAADPHQYGETVACYLCKTSFPVSVKAEDLDGAPTRTVVDVIEDYLGDTFDVAAAKNLCDVPQDDLDALFKELHHFYRDWLEMQVESRWGKVDDNEYHLFIPYPEEYAAVEHVKQCKKLFLYLPRITWHDPLAEQLLPIFMMWSFQLPVDRHQIHNALRVGLESLALLAPLVKSGDLTLVPQAAVLNYNLLQLKVQQDLEQISDAQRDEIIDQCARAANRTDDDYEFGLPAMFEASKVWGHFCAMMGYIPVACDPMIQELLTQEYAHSLHSSPRIPKATHRVATSLFHYDLPGIHARSLEDLLALREDVDAFRNWRLGIEEVMEHVRREEPRDSEQEKVELKHACEAILTPKVEALNKEIKGSSVLEKVLIPGAVAASSMALTWHITGSPAISTGLSGLLTTGSWVLDKVRHRMLRKTRKAAAVREVYNVMLDTRRN